MSPKTNKKPKPKILIADDSELNREMLVDILSDDYDCITAESGMDALVILQQHGIEIDLVLLDINMPGMDGFDVLAVMNRNNWIDRIPVMVISAENASSYIERAYNLGVTDYIGRPFDAQIVRRRVANTIMLYAKQKRLIGLVADQIYEKEKNSSMLIAILSHIVEFRNGESGLHVLHINTMTKILLETLVRKTDKYNLTSADIDRISIASSLHDIGKISIPESILNKPGKLTDEEFAEMKNHTVIGAAMLDGISIHNDEPLVKTAYEICRWHHERYDGKGYPDGLKGEDIPISAQIVALADVYDALTSRRCYKPAYSHSKALKMILDGECGAFNPLLLECLIDSAEQIKHELTVRSIGHSVDLSNQRQIEQVTQEVLQKENIATSKQTFKLLELERIKYNFAISFSEYVFFDYNDIPPILNFSDKSAHALGISATISGPLSSDELSKIISPDDLLALSRLIRSSEPTADDVKYNCFVNVKGVRHRAAITCRPLWSNTDEEAQYIGFVGAAEILPEVDNK